MQSATQNQSAKAAPAPILCDGCGAVASPEHIAARVLRLELATRFRPIHVAILFVAIAPPPLIEDDFYNVEGSRASSDPLFAALGIAASAKTPAASSADSAAATAQLNEFQHRGYYLTYLFECPLDSATAEVGPVADALSRRASTLVKRIQFNYRPKHIALLGSGITPLAQKMQEAGLGELLLLDSGAALTIPEISDSAATARFREVVSEKASGSSSAAMV